MEKFLEMFKKPTGRYSVAAICVVVTMLIWWFSWLYLELAGKTFAHFDTCTIANWSTFFVVLLRNSIETRLFSIKVNDEKPTQRTRTVGGTNDSRNTGK